MAVLRINVKYLSMVRKHDRYSKKNKEMRMKPQGGLLDELPNEATEMKQLKNTKLKLKSLSYIFNKLQAK